MNNVSSRWRRIFIGIAGALIATGILLMVWGIVRVQQSVLAQDRENLLVLAKSTARSIDNYLDGCLGGVVLTQKTPAFSRDLQNFRATGDGAPLLIHLDILASEEHPAVTDAALIDREGHELLATAAGGEYERLADGAGRPGDGKLRVYRNRAGALFLGIVTAVDADDYLLSYLDVERLYRSTAAFATLGEKGYVMIKLSRGLILMHPVAAQRGNDVLEGRRAQYPDLDYAELERLIADQETGKEGIETYYSYWWADSPPSRVRKISAYTPVHVQDDFLIISAVVDYEELLRPIHYSSAIIIAAAVLVCLGATAMFFRRRWENQRVIERENFQLRESNRLKDELAQRREEMQHNQRLQLIGTLTGGIAHEFRNLLTPIMGYAGLMREGLPPDSPWREDIDEIYSCSMRAKEIIQQITSLSRKNLEPVFEPMRLDEAVSSILKVASAAKPADVEIMQRLDFDGKFVMGNETQINQVVLNLCNNAFHALQHGGGHLWVEGGTERREGREYAVLTVRDDGPGIEPAIRERIFDPFFTTKRTGDGTGLGLSIVQNIVDMHHGRIEVDSTPGKGTTFTLFFPTMAPETVATAPETPAPAPLDGQLSIALVEDDLQVLKLLERGLVRGGFSVRAFAEPLEALRELRREPCRLLITDYNMPRMTGAELAMRTKESSPQTKILILTGFADKDILDYLRRDIIDGYQIKPVPIAELLEKIHSLFA